jgi:hypothetical protein
VRMRSYIEVGGEGVERRGKRGGGGKHSSSGMVDRGRNWIDGGFVSFTEGKQKASSKVFPLLKCKISNNSCG